MSNASDTNLTDTNLNANSFLYSLADTLDQLNQQIKNDTTLTIDNIPKALSIIETAKDLFKELKEVEIYEDVNLLNNLQNTVNTLKNSLETLINNVQNKLDNNEFKGDRGVSISNIQNVNNNLVITDTENKQYDLGNYVNDYNNLLNKPVLIDSSWVFCSNLLINNWVSYNSSYNLRYRKINNQIFFYGIIKNGTVKDVLSLFPSSLKPSYNVYFPVLCRLSDGSFKINLGVLISNTSTITLDSLYPNIDWVLINFSYVL